MGTRIRENLLAGALRLCKRLDRRGPPRAARRILVISSTALGDLLLSTPGLRSLRLAYPEAHIALMANASLIELARCLPGVDEIIPYHGGYRRFFRLAWHLHRGAFDVAVILHGNEPQATPLAYLSGARGILKLPNTSRFRFLLTNREPVRDWDAFEHGIDQRLETATLAGGAPTDRRMDIVVSDDARASLGRFPLPTDARVLALQPGASTTSRRWAKARFVELGKQLLAANPGLWIAITGSPAERALAQAIADEIDHPQVWVAAGEVPLGLMPAFLARCAVLVSGDTGPMHLAVAVGTPVVALFAVSDARRSGPTQDAGRHIVIQKWRTCEPCLSKRCPYAEPLCMENISVAEVAAAVSQQLARGAP